MLRQWLKKDKIRMQNAREDYNIDTFWKISKTFLDKFSFVSTWEIFEFDMQTVHENWGKSF